MAAIAQVNNFPFGGGLRSIWKILLGCSLQQQTNIHTHGRAYIGGSFSSHSPPKTWWEMGKVCTPEATEGCLFLHIGVHGPIHLQVKKYWRNFFRNCGKHFSGFSELFIISEKLNWFVSILRNFFSVISEKLDIFSGITEYSELFSEFTENSFPLLRKSRQKILLKNSCLL